MTADAFFFNTGPLRLAQGNTSFEGRAESFQNGEWGSICDTQISPSDGWAKVFCRDLFGTYVIKASKCSKMGYPAGNGSISIYSPSCRSVDARNMSDCTNGKRIGSCSHRKDVCLICGELISSLNAILLYHLLNLCICE